MDKFYTKYLVFDYKKNNIVSKAPLMINNSKELDKYKCDLFSILPKSHILSVYCDILNSHGFDVSLIICKMSSKESYDKVKEKLTSYFGIYQKTKEISSIYLFDDLEFTFVELTSGTLDGDELIDKLANKICKKIKLKRSDFICDADFEEEYNDLID